MESVMWVHVLRQSVFQFLNSVCYIAFQKHLTLLTLLDTEKRMQAHTLHFSLHTPVVFYFQTKRSSSILLLSLSPLSHTKVKHWCTLLMKLPAYSTFILAFSPFLAEKLILPLCVSVCWCVSCCVFPSTPKWLSKQWSMASLSLMDKSRAQHLSQQSRYKC